jgi:beta-xylosidase
MGLVSSSFFILVLSAGLLEAADTYSNPVIDEIGPADPTVVCHEGMYYLYPTGDNTSYHVYTSPDLVSWTKGLEVFSPGVAGVWAPDVFYNPADGKFYLYYTVNWKIGVAIANNPDETFVDQGVLIYNSIDAHLFEDDDGKYYLFFVTPDSNGLTIYVEEMTSLLESSGVSTKIIEPSELWERGVTEGPWMVKHEGVYYLLYSGGGASVRYYAVGYATANDPLGPFTKYPANPIISQGHGVYGPGHGCVTKDAFGDLWHVYHQKEGPDDAWDRFICIDPVGFDANGVLHAQATRGTEEPAPIVCLAGDFDSDWDTDWTDLGTLVQEWLTRCRIDEWCDGRDINRDSRVDLIDFSILTEYWLEEIECLCPCR